MKTFLCVIVFGAVLASAGQALAQSYKPNWDSLDKRPVPAWFTDAKFGIFIHWGVYSVPAWGPKKAYSEWYWNHMEDKNGPTWKFHVDTYGADFQYQDFAPMFKAEMFDPAQWADIFKRSGAKYVVLTSKHHEGFCLWPSAQSWNWNAVDIGPHRDLLGDLTQAVKDAGLKMGYYYSLYEWYNPVYRADLDKYVDERMLPQLRDLVTRYKPAMIWPDGEWDQPSKTWRSEEFLAWLYNESPVKEEIVVNDRWGKECRGKHGGFYTSEYSGHGGDPMSAAHPWEECQGMGASFGYNRNESLADYRTPKELIRLLVDTASRGGNLLLDIGPTADGRIPVIMEERLVQMGEWLTVNGEAIYGTTAGPVASFPWGGCTSGKDKVYLHVFDWPQGALDVPGLKLNVEKAYLLGGSGQQPLTVESHENGLRITLPAQPANSIATVIVLQTQK